ncbi:hypothetical protein CDAR_492881 [Caerostris darwini]|uniref:C2H2-type domain-containing protein n=1 Tax=Caerostris darwini TaxID=1538125 RepID=A0AAV4TGM0_9ARAC|nr:hypothetical protein CDAR_492881 [Caerostris darwini]
MVLNVIEWLKEKLCRCCSSLESEEEFKSRLFVCEGCGHISLSEKGLRLHKLLVHKEGPSFRKNPGCQRPTPQLLWRSSCFTTENQLSIKAVEDQELGRRRRMAFYPGHEKAFYPGHEKAFYPGLEKTFYHGYEKTFYHGQVKTFNPGHEKTFYHGQVKTFYYGQVRTFNSGREKKFYHGYEKTFYHVHGKIFYHGHEKTFYHGHEKTFYHAHEKIF